jgi:lipopolysaccharide/colanic/teichoic acid biosynthesis glycosyltransferase
MRVRSPSSRGAFKARLSLFDSFWALASPLLALYFRDAYILSFDGALDTAIYCLISLAFSLVAFATFRIGDGMTRYFSVHDSVDVAKAVLMASLLTYISLFTFTRLDGIPRSIPFIHALILAAGLIAARTFARLSESDRTAPVRHGNIAAEHIVMIGSNRLSSLYMKFMEAYSASTQRVMAVLDDRPHMIGRTIDGVRIVGPTQHLEPIVNEFLGHGIRVDRVIVGGEPDMLSENVLGEIRSICDQHEIRLDFVPQLVGLSGWKTSQTEIAAEAEVKPEPNFALPFYFGPKRFIDFFGTVAIIAVLSPLMLLVGIVALFDVGSPILFWQQRLGQGGRTFLLQKIRTLQPSFDGHGLPVPEMQRLSWVGSLLRRTRFDELPQLLNVLVGDMSLIGPRPLLPRDQPPNPSVRLMVRPGITGWAQVKGGNLLTPSEKHELDEWYIRNASLWLDVRIIFMTIQVLLRGERRSERALADARAMCNGKAKDRQERLTNAASILAARKTTGSGP